jgi:hypothetical protein
MSTSAANAAYPLSMQPHVTLQRFEPSHLARLDEWVRRPHVAPWYSDPDGNLEWAANPPAGGHQRIIANGAIEVGYLRWQYVDRATLDSLGPQRARLARSSRRCQIEGIGCAPVERGLGHRQGGPEPRACDELGLLGRRRLRAAQRGSPQQPGDQSLDEARVTISRAPRTLDGAELPRRRVGTACCGPYIRRRTSIR